MNEEFQRKLQELSERLRQAEQVANESQAEAAVYRELLEDLYKAAQTAIQENDVGLLYRITMKLDFNFVPSKSEVTLWGKSFLHTHVRGMAWLERAKQSLERIEAYAGRLTTHDSPTNDELKLQIMDAARDGLIPRV